MSKSKAAADGIGLEGHQPAGDSFDRIVAQLKDVRPTSKGVRAKCPAHDDHTPSLDVDRGEGGKVLIKCRSAGCATEAIVAEIGLTMRDLFSDRTGQQWAPKSKATGDGKPPTRHADLAKAARAAQWSSTERGKITPSKVTRYDYTDQEGTVVGGVFRFDFADGRPKALRRFRRDGGAWILRDIEAPRPLYHLHNLVKASVDEPVLFVEGEKCVEAAIALGLIATTSAGGAKQPLAKTNFGPLANRHVVILPDNDAPGHTYAAGIAAQAQQAGAATVRLLDLPGLGEGQDIHDWIELKRQAGLHDEQIVRDLTTLIESAPAASLQADPVACHPVITLSPGHLREAVVAAESALLANPDAERIYQRGTQLARVARVDEPTAPRRGTLVPARTPVIAAVGSTYLRSIFETSAQFVRVGEGGETKVVSCPADIPACYAQSAGHWRLPVLRAITTAPTMRHDGTILQVPGYDAASCLLYDPSGVVFPLVPEAPTLADAEAAAERIASIVCHFDFVDDGAASVWLASLLTAMVRPTLPAAPMFVIDAPTRGSGKSKLANIVGVIATGRMPATMSLVDDVDEVRKRILALLLQGSPVVNIDNVDVPIGGAALCSVLTEQTYCDRILGASEIVRVPTTTTWISTGNNTVINGDMTRRVLQCRLDPKCERPEDRRFKFDPVSVAEERRPSLVVDTLTILRAHAVAGRPQCGIGPFGSFEVWSEVIRAAIVWIGMADPIAGRQAVVEQDGGASAVAELLRAWHAVFGDRQMTTRQVLNGASQDLLDAVDEVVGADVAPSNRGRRLGQTLAQWRDRIVGGYQAVRGLDAQGGTGRWSVVEIGSPEPGHSGEGGNGGNGGNPDATRARFPTAAAACAGEEGRRSGAEVPTLPTVPTIPGFPVANDLPMAGPDDGLPEQPGGTRGSRVTRTGGVS